MVVVIYFCNNFQWHFEVRKPPASWHHINTVFPRLLWKKELRFISCILKQVQTVACKRRSTALISGMQTGSPSLRCQKWDLSPAWTSYATLLQVSPWAFSYPIPTCLTGLNVTVTAACFFQILPFHFFFKCALIYFSSLPLSHQNHWA